MINDKGKIKNKLLQFLDNKGFYIVLFICVGIITLTAFVVTKRNIASYMDENPFESMISEFEAIEGEKEKIVLEEKQNSDLKSNIIDEKIEDSIPEKTDNGVSTNKEIHSNLENNTVGSEEIIPTSIIKDIKMEFPVQGKVLIKHTKENLIYSKTLDQWTTHNGIDIGAKRGEPVRAAFDGIVTDVYNDTKYGITIVIKHDNGLETRYSNLSTVEMAKKGLIVKTKDVISGIGNTSLFEAGEEDHLHFEIFEAGKSVDPLKYLE